MRNLKDTNGLEEFKSETVCIPKELLQRTIAELALRAYNLIAAAVRFELNGQHILAKTKRDEAAEVDQLREALKAEMDK
jgi:hypothetical protein